MEEKNLTYLVPPGSEARSLKPGDILLVNETADENLSVLRIDTLLPEVWKKQQKSHFQTGAIAADIVQQVFNHLNQMEKNHRHKLQADGIAVSKAKGVKFGRPRKEPPENFGELISSWEQGKMSLAELLEETGIKESTFYSLLQGYRKEQKK